MAGPEMPFFAALFVIFPVVFGLVVVAMVVTMVMRYRAAKRAGIDPISGDIQIASTLNRSALLAPPPGKSVVERLADLDALRHSGAISETEYDAQRQRILGTI